MDAAIELIALGVTDTLGVVASSVRRLFLVQEVGRATTRRLAPGSADASTSQHVAAKPRARRRKRRGRPVDVQQVKGPTSSCEPLPRCDMDILTPICALVASALYYNTIGAGFVYDDR